MVEVESPSAGRLMGWAVTVTVKGGPGVNSTVVVPYFESEVAVMVAVPATVSEVSVAVATPLVVVLVIVVEPKLPRLVVKVTTVPLAT